FGSLIMLTLKGCEGKRQAAAIEVELLDALQRSDYGGLTGPAKQACIKLFQNQKWELPSELQPREIQTPTTLLTLWDGVQLYVSDASYTCLARPDRYDEMIAHIVSFFGKNKAVKEIWISDLKHYRTHRSNEGVANATINREMSAMSGIFRVLVEHQLVENNPCRLLKRLSEKSGQRQVYISFQDINNIMELCPEWFQDMLWIAYLTGMRQGEIYKLRWRHINLNTRIITFHATETKEGQPKRVPIHRDLMPLLDRIGKVRSLSDDRLFKISTQSLRMPWVRALDKLQWQDPRPRFHDVRHTWKTNARRSGVDSEIREAILGHSDKKLDVSERYGFIDDYELVNAIDKFSYDNGSTKILVAAKTGC
ncbi:MAG: site-specific integrase, partial [Syntrophaceae bacterium]|nr:site-specific integrase [Syntrophaceae bacterium]